MDESSLMHNQYFPYGNYDSNINNIIKKEKEINEKRVKEYNEKKSKLFTTDLYYISEQITYVIHNTIELFLLASQHKIL